MQVELAVAGACWLVLAFGHTTIGVRWVLPGLEEVPLPRTPLGSRTLTRNMLRFTWHVVTIFLVGFGVLFSTLAASPHADTKTLLLRWTAGLMLVATARALWDVRHQLRSLQRLPVPLLFVVIAALCLAASA
jgi:hypothetical protein